MTASLPNPSPLAAGLHIVYGASPAELSVVGADGRQVSPLTPGAEALEEAGAGSLAGAVVLAPPGSGERRYVLAQALRALAAGAPLTALAPKDKGGSRLRKELQGFGCVVDEEARRHFRICRAARPAAPTGLEAAIVDGGPRLVEALGLWSQPGVFSWDRIDPGSALLAETLPALAGEGVDLGCGTGFLSRTVLRSDRVQRLTLIDIDRRAVQAAARNVTDPRARLMWADARAADDSLQGMDFLVMNPPFHRDGHEDYSLGQGFIQRAAQMLRKGGVCWLVANRHLPYEAGLNQLFARVEVRLDRGGYKVLEARR